ncbi:MAG: ATP-binding cassette domain-containing protein [Desulfobacterales bacterium]|nr:ATP-binding cassette domain-containing protein [Desulfobacterales bacterium]
MTNENNRKRLHIRKMWKERGEQKRKIRIEIPEFEVSPGGFVAIVGANGSGKSTLLDMLGMIISPDHADKFMLQATTSQIDLTRLSPSEKLSIRRNYFSYVLQTCGLLEFLSIRDNIRFAARLKDKPLSKIGDVAQTLDIEDILDKRPGRASGGQRQKAAIACALVQEPKIILADEPTSAMDTPSAARLMKTFRHLTDEAGASLIMVTHDYDLVQGSADTFYHFRIREKADGAVSSVLAPGPPDKSKSVA